MDADDRDPCVEEFLHAHTVATIRRCVLVALPALAVGAAALVYGRYLHTLHADAFALPVKLLAFGLILVGLGWLLVLVAIAKAIVLRRKRRRMGPPIPVARIRRSSYGRS